MPRQSSRKKAVADERPKKLGRPRKATILTAAQRMKQSRQRENEREQKLKKTEEGSPKKKMGRPLNPNFL